MKKLSSWASHHRKLSWTIITLCQVLIYFAAMYTGYLLHDAGITLPLSVFLIALSILIISAILYPPKSFRSNRYVLQKTCDFAIGLSVFVCLCFFYNDNNKVSSFNTYSSLQGSLSLPKAMSKKDSSFSLATVSLSKKELRKQARDFKKLFQAYKGQQEDDAIGKTVWIILVVIGALVGLSFVAVLACSLSCSGADVAAALVGIAGVVGLIWLAVHFIKKILRKKSRREKPVNSN